MFQVVQKEFQRYLKEVEEACQGSFNGVSKLFQESVKGISRKFQGGFLYYLNPKISASYLA